MKRQIYLTIMLAIFAVASAQWDWYLGAMQQQQQQPIQQGYYGGYGGAFGGGYPWPHPPFYGAGFQQQQPQFGGGFPQQQQPFGGGFPQQQYFGNGFQHPLGGEQQVGGLDMGGGFFKKR